MKERRFIRQKKGGFRSWMLVAGLWILIAGCAGLTTVKTTIEDPKGEQWKITSKSDAHVKAKKPDGTEVEVDNRGRLGFWEGLLQYMLSKPDITIEK